MRRLVYKRWLHIALILVASVAMLGAGSDARFKDLGRRMMCPCGCSEILTECNHVGCPYSDTMRKELAAAVDAGGSDDSILQQFAEKYGNTVLAAPTKKGFDLVAWIMPGAVLVGGIWLTLILLRKWKYRVEPAVTTDATPVQLSAFRAQARHDTEI